MTDYITVDMEGAMSAYTRGQQLSNLSLSPLDFLKIVGDSGDEDIMLEALFNFIPGAQDEGPEVSSHMLGKESYDQDLIDAIDAAVQYFLLAYEYLHTELGNWVDCTEKVVNPIAIDKRGGVIYAISIQSYHI